MHPLAEAWARDQVRKAELRELRALAETIRRQQAEMRPKFERLRAERQERMRQDGPNGFVMVENR